MTQSSSSAIISNHQQATSVSSKDSKMEIKITVMAINLFICFRVAAAAAVSAILSLDCY